MVCLSLICEAILLTGNIPKYHSKTAFKIFLISVGMTSEVLTTLKLKLDFVSNVEEDSLSIFDQTLGEIFSGMG